MRDWRNIQSASMDVSKQFVVLYGKNGSGKTNILESVYVFAALRSFRENQPRHLIKHGCAATQIGGNIRFPHGVRKMQWSYGSQGRNLWMDGVKTTELAAWFANVRVILFCPDHLKIVRGGAEKRRQFLDRARFTAYPGYLDVVRSYQRILSHKKALLRHKTVDKDQLLIWNEQLVDAGVKVAIQRRLVIQELGELFQKMYRFLSETEKVTLVPVGLAAHEPADMRAFFVKELKRLHGQEIAQQRALCGPHRDDMKILINNISARKFASQGQVRSIVLALKLAELNAAEQRGESPIFLLDDLSSELDRERTSRLVQMLAEKNNQVWITTTDTRYLSTLPTSAVSRWYIEQGKPIRK